MNKQPEALRLAEALDRQYLHACEPAAAELRRLAAVEAQRDALLAALRWIATVNAMDYEYQQVARAAIKAAEEAPHGIGQR
jgi:hypothetical protein